MKKIGLHLQQLTVPEKITLAHGSVTAMGGNPAFTTPDVPLADMTKAADDADAAMKKAEASHATWLADASRQRDAEAALDQKLTTQARYVERVSAGDETKLKSSALPLAATPVHKTGVLAAVQRVSTTHGDHDGEVDVQFDKLKGARSYQLETAPTAEGPWTIVQVPTSSKATLSGITKPVWVRVAGIDGNGPGVYSDPVQTP